MHLYLKICALVALCISAGAQAATNWQDLKVGGGGFVRGLNIASDGTMVGRTDTNGAYLWNGSAWVQLVNSSSLPATLINSTDIGNIGTGVYEVAIAPGNSSLMYMAYMGYVFKSTNKGTIWTQTSFARDTSMDPNANPYAQYGQKIAIDPNNSNVVYVGAPRSGLRVTTDGGNTWNTVAGVPAGTGGGTTGILFYPGGGQVGGVTQVIYAARNGTSVYKTTNGGTTWTLTTGGPTDVEYAAIDTSGNYYAVGNSGANLFKYSGGSWTTTSAPQGGTPLQAVAINPFNQSEIVVVNQGGQIAVSFNGGSSWNTSNSNNLVATDIPWLLAAQGSGSWYLTSGGLAFSPITQNLLILSAGTGTWQMNVPASSFPATTPLTWNDFSVGIENLVANAIVVPPTATSYPILVSWDRPFFKITNPNTYPTTYGPVNYKLTGGWSADYASSDPTFVAGLADGAAFGGPEESGYSTDGGATWTYFATAAPGSGTGGTIAASTPQNIIWAPANRVQPSYTNSQGASWTGITLPGVSSWNNFHFAYYLKQRSVTADRVLPNTFYLYYAGYGVFKTTDGGATWTNVHAGYIESNSSWSGFNSTIMSVPGNAGHLFYTSGPLGGVTPNSPAADPLYRSTDGGATWKAVPNVIAVSCFGFGAAASGKTYPAIYIVGYVNNVFGIWQSVDNTQSWTNMGTYPTGGLDEIGTISGDPNNYGEVYVGFSGGGFAYLPAGSAQSIPMAPTNLTVH